MSSPHCSLDARGLSCPMPLLKTKLALNGMEPGDILEVVATDPGSLCDIPAFIRLSAHELISADALDDGFRFLIRCGQNG